ncbi:hypothetical protein JW911_01685 [Candidatus Peregrinibacteria bacterium]|nr:hypothetical protein [Candidatus Peregrinibacteria bacterium]
MLKKNDYYVIISNKVNKMLLKKQKNKIRIKALIKAFHGLNKRLGNEILLLEEFKKALDRLKLKRTGESEEEQLKKLEKQIGNLKTE